MTAAEAKGDGSAAALAAFASYIKKDVRRRQGLVPDIRIKRP